MVTCIGIRLLRYPILKQLKNHPFLCNVLSFRRISTLRERGIIQDIFPMPCFAELEKMLLDGCQTAYCGYDPTADSLHIGNLLSIIALLHWQTLGHRPIIVIGDYTAEIGDPSGRSTGRSKIEYGQIQSNSNAIEESVKNIFSNFEHHLSNKFSSYTNKYKILRNSQWYDKKSGVFLQEMGHHFRVGSMLTRESVKVRLTSKDGFKLSEFLYPVFQSYDWLHLVKESGCFVQFGGNDQMGNIYAGHDLISRILNKNVFGITVPLITSSSGEKLGKSLGNAIWLNPCRTSPTKFFEYFLNTSDEDVHHYLKLFTFISMNDINKIMAEHKENPQLKIAQETLATNIALLVHGDMDLKSVKESDKEEKKLSI